MKLILKIIEGFIITYFFLVYVVMSAVDIFSILIIDSTVDRNSSQTYFEKLSFFLFMLIVIFFFIRTYQANNKYNKVMLGTYLACFGLSILFTLLVMLFSILFEQGYEWFYDASLLILFVPMFVYTLSKFRRLH